jgi:myo-inositol-1(or 4)-monophosphatase
VNVTLMVAEGTDDRFEREVVAAVEAARAARELILSHAGGIDRDGVREKGRHDLVTEVDERSQRIIIQHLAEAFPDYGFLAEEDTEGARAAASRRWIIDPIDGTTNFTHGVPPYAVSIALTDGDDIVVGVVLEVVSGELFTAVRGRGSFLNGERMHVSTVGDLTSSLISTGFPYRAVDHLDAYLEVLGAFMFRCQGVRRHGSASIDLAYLAAGRFDGFFETGLMPWDVAAGVLLIREAGGCVSRFSGEGDPVFSRQILASNGRIHEAMRGAVAPLLHVAR